MISFSPSITALQNILVLRNAFEKTKKSKFIDAALELESAILQYQRAESKLGGAVTTIGKKVDTINQHIDKVMENAPTKLKVSVNVNDAD